MTASLFSLIFLTVVVLILVLAVVLEIRFFRRFAGGWKWASLLPAVILGFVVLRILVDTFRDPTSHNLWPFEILLWSLAGLFFLALLWLAHKLA